MPDPERKSDPDFNSPPTDLSERGKRDKPTAPSLPNEDERVLQAVCERVCRSPGEYRKGGRWLDDGFGLEAWNREQREIIETADALGYTIVESGDSWESVQFSRLREAHDSLLYTAPEGLSEEHSQAVFVLSWLVWDGEAEKHNLGITEFERWRSTLAQAMGHGGRDSPPKGVDIRDFFSRNWMVLLEEAEAVLRRSSDARREESDPSPTEGVEPSAGADGETPPGRPLGERFKVEDDTRVLFDGHDVGMPTGKAVEVFGLLLKQRGEVVPTEELLVKADDDVGGSRLHNVISDIRACLKQANVPAKVTNKRGRGYVLEAGR